jgi:hypothetical protein
VFARPESRARTNGAHGCTGARLAHQLRSSVRRQRQSGEKLHIFCATKENHMKQPNDFFQDFQNRMSDLLKHSPAKDVERNVKAMLSQGFSKLDLVTREEFDTQAQVLLRTRTRLEELERRVAELEQRLAASQES